jgi:hypothetical protein
LFEQGFMRVALQNSKSGQFIQGPGKWTLRLRDALGFSSSEAAMAYAHEERLAEATIWVLDEPREKIAIPPRPITAPANALEFIAAAAAFQERQSSPVSTRS